MAKHQDRFIASGSSPDFPPKGMSDADALRLLVEAAKQGMATGSASSSSHPPKGETVTSSEKKDAGAESERKGKRRVNSPPARSGKYKPLENPVKLRIIELYAQFYTAASIRLIIDEEFGKWLEIRQIAAYDPTKRSANVGKKLRALFDQIRAEYVSRSCDMAMAHQAHRLRLIGDIVEKASNSKDYTAALKGLELAAKEVGGVLEGKQTVIHQGAIAHVHGTLEDARAEVAMRLQQIVDGGILEAVATPALDDKSGQSVAENGG